MNRRVGTDVTVKLLPLNQEHIVENLTGSYSALNDGAIISNGILLTKGSKSTFTKAASSISTIQK
jgi:hypothetical protein